MTNKKIWLGMLVMVLVFGITVSGCKNGDGDGNPSGSGGEFTLTGIPAQYRYLDVDGGNESLGIWIWGGNYDAKTNTDTLVPISNGSAKIPIWLNYSERDDIILERYSGSHTFEVGVHIYDSDISENSQHHPVMLTECLFYSVKFTNGNATKSWNDADEYY